MKEILRSGNSFEISLVKGLLRENGIESVLLDSHAGSLYHGAGGIAARLMVQDRDYCRAKKILKEVQS